MVDPKLVDYIKKAKEAGQTDEQIKSILLENGWNESDMAGIFESVNVPQSEPQSNPEPQLQPQVQPTQNSPIQKRSKMSLALKLFIVLIVVVIIGGGGGLLFSHSILNFVSNIFGPSPESIILKAWDNLETINSQNFDSELLLNGEVMSAGNQGNTFDVVIKANGGVDVNNGLSLIEASITASVIDGSTSDKYDFFLSGEARSIQKDLYVILKDIDLGGFEDFITMFGVPDVNEIKERWFKFQLDEMAQEQLMKQNSIISGQQVDIEKDFNDLVNKVVKILLDKKVYDIDKLQDNVGVDGKEYHYRISLNREKLIEASPEIFNVLKEYRDKYDSSEYTLEEFQKSLNEMFDIVGEISADLFIGKDDNFFHKIQFVKDLNIDDGVVKINYKIETTGINKPIEVSIPNEYEDFKDAISYFTIRGSINQMSSITQQVCIANKNCYSVCKNGLLNGSQKTYGETLASFNETIIDQGGTNPVCFSSVQNYCISTQLADGSWLCVGDGKLGKTECISAKTICQ